MTFVQKLGPMKYDLTISFVSVILFWGSTHLLGPTVWESYAKQSLFLVVPLIVGMVGQMLPINRGRRVVTRGNLDDREAMLRSILENVPARIASSDALGDLDYANKLDGEEQAAKVTGSGWIERVQPDEHEKVAAAWFRSIATGEAMDITHRLKGSNGDFRWYRAHVEPPMSGTGKEDRWYGLIVDIDEEKTVELALRSHQRNLYQHINSIPTLIWSTDAEGRVEFLNRKWLEYTGMNEDAALAGGWTNVVHPDDRDTLAERLSSGEAEVRLRRFDGEYRWFLLRTQPVIDDAGVPIKWYGTNTDVHDLKLAQQALADAEKSFRTTLDRIPVPVITGLPDGSVDYINARWAEEGFLPVDVFAGIPGMAHPDEVTTLLEKRGAAAHSNAPWEGEARMRKADGSYQWYLARSITAFDERGMPTRSYATVTNIDDRKRAEQTLQSREGELRQIIDTVPAMIFVIAGDGVPIYMNERIERYYGLRFDELPDVEGSQVTGAIRARVHPEDSEMVEIGFKTAFETGRPTTLKYRNIRFDGMVRWVEGRLEPLLDDEAVVVRWYGVVIDIHDEVVAQDQFRTALEKLSRASQLASLAELSASIAHEINQPLAAIVSNSSACQRRLEMQPLDIERIKTIADRIVRDANTVADILERVRALFKQHVQAKSWLNINQAIAEVISLLNSGLTTHEVTCQTELDFSLPELLADRVQIQQVLVNLIRNGIEAISTNTNQPREILVRTFQSRTDRIEVEISDTGVGIADLDRIFEPFFTTKTDGMGMGLAICKSIVSAHGGLLSARRVEPRGSTFLMSLPLQVTELAQDPA